MKATFFIILFIVLWFTDYYLAAYYYPDFKIDHVAWDNFVLYRESIFEISYFVILFLGVFKRTNLSRALSVFALILVGSSIIDKKIHLVSTWQYYDPVVILFGIFVATIIYRHGRN